MGVEGVNVSVKRLHGCEVAKMSQVWRCGSLLPRGGQRNAKDRPPLTICVSQEAKCKSKHERGLRKADVV